MFTKESMFEELKKNGFNDTTFILADGTSAIVTPCYYGKGAPSLEDIEYFLVYCDELPYLSDDKLEKVAERFNNILKLRSEQDAEKIELRKYFDEHQSKGWDDGSWSWYSDWHKDVYGYRPHGYVCGVYVNPHTGITE